MFDTPLLYVVSFLVLSVGNFDQFLTRPLLSQFPTSFMDGLLSVQNLLTTQIHPSVFKLNVCQLRWSSVVSQNGLIS